MIKGYNLVVFHYFNSLVKFKDQDKVATFRNGFTVYTNDLKKIEIEAFFSNLKGLMFMILIELPGKENYGKIQIITFYVHKSFINFQKVFYNFTYPLPWTLFWS